MDNETRDMAYFKTQTRVPERVLKFYKYASDWKS